MAFLTLRQGDLFFSRAQAVAHGVNIKGFMGAGVAKEFRIRYPVMYSEYKALCVSDGLPAGGVFPWRDAESGRWVYNIASQDEPGPHARLEWVESGVREMIAHATDMGVGTIAMPRIGCGIGGLRWSDVERVVSQVAAESDSVHLEVWSQ